MKSVPRHPRSLVAAVALIMVGCSPPPTTQRTLHYSTGEQRWRYDGVLGVPHGKSTTWHRNGAKRSVGRYWHGLQHGLFRYYDEQGAFERDVYFIAGEKVWESTVLDERPPAALRKDARRAKPPRDVTETPFGKWVRKGRGPEPHFATLDRATSLDRVGVQVGWSVRSSEPRASVLDRETPELTTVRAEVFGNYVIGRYSVYGQVATSTLAYPDGRDVRGKSTIELSTARHAELSGVGDLSARLGLMVPVSGDGLDSLVASADSAYQRPADGASAFSADATLRSSLTLANVYGNFVFQSDAGIDWLFGGAGDQAPVGALARVNAAIGAGVGRFMITLELSNAMLLESGARPMRALATTATFFAGDLIVSVGASFGNERHGGALASVAYGF